MGKLVADYLNIKNDGGVIKDLDGNILGIGGDNYSWVDETDNRDLGTTYVNDTGRPIMVNAYIHDSDTNASIEVDDIKVAYTYKDTWGLLTCIVPNGSTYKFNGTDLNLAAELK